MFGSNLKDARSSSQKVYRVLGMEVANIDIALGKTFTRVAWTHELFAPNLEFVAIKPMLWY